MRIPFAEVIEDEHLLGTFWEDTAWPARVLLKAFYGLDLSAKVINPKTGWNELDYWAIVQGSFKHDDLGFVTEITPVAYSPKEYDQLWAVVGRRAAKTTRLLSIVVAYEALFGGHEDYVGKKQDCVIYLIAHRMDLAKGNLQHIRAIIDSSPLLKDEVVVDIAERITLRNGISIVPSPPSLKAQRGVAVPVAAMDEVAFWYSDADAANPDFEVERAVSYSQLQFPHAKRLGASTPWTKEGLLYKYHVAGTEGQKLPTSVDKKEYEGILTAFATTASFENPLIDGKKLAQLKLADPDAFARESLCQFLDSVSGFLNSALLEDASKRAVEQRLTERPPVTGPSLVQPNYIAAMDPAFRSDSFGFVILHKDANDGIVVDAVRRYTPIKGQKLNPNDILAELKPILDSYNVNVVYSDQYQFESLQQLALGFDIHVEVVDFTGRSKAKIFGNLQQLVNQRKLQLLDPFTNEDAAEMLQELRILERKIGSGGSVAISAPEGKHDDMACVLALGAYKAIWLDPTIKTPQEVFGEPEPSLFDRGMATIRKNQQQLDYYGGY